MRDPCFLKIKNIGLNVRKRTNQLLGIFSVEQMQFFGLRIFTSVCQVDCVALIVNYAGVFDIGNVCVGTYCLNGRTGREIICPKSCLLLMLYFMTLSEIFSRVARLHFVEEHFIVWPCLSLYFFFLVVPQTGPWYRFLALPAPSRVSFGKKKSAGRRTIRMIKMIYVEVDLVIH